MAAIDPVQVPCPACGETITVPLTATTGERRKDGTVEVRVPASHEPIRNHIDRHLARLRTAQIRYGWTAEQTVGMPDHVLDALLAVPDEPLEEP